MKKISSLVLALFVLTSLSISALAAEISVNDRVIPKAQAVTMLPLRATAEAAGFTVLWDASLPGARIERDSLRGEVILGRDLYAIAQDGVAAAPQSLGAAPALLQKGVIYVPSTFFSVLLGLDSVVIGEGGAVQLHTNAVQLPNPQHVHESTASLESAVGFPVPLPTAPAGFVQTQIQDIGGTLAEIQWSDDVQELSYRISRGSSDNSGDYTVYPASGTIAVGSTALQWRGQPGNLQVVVWSQGGFSHSLRATDGLTENQVRQMVASIL